MAVARAGGAPSLSRPQSRHGLALRRRARHAPARWAHRAAVGGADRVRPCLVGRARGRRLLWAGLLIDARILRIACGAILIGWAFYHWRYGHRHRVRFGMQTGLIGLGVWSFLIATAHGAGLMLWPALMPLCIGAGAEPGTTGPVATALLGIGVHTAAMLSVTAAMAIAVYEWVGLELLRRAWINVDLVWTWALVAAGAWLLLVSLIAA